MAFQNIDASLSAADLQAIRDAFATITALLQKSAKPTNESSPALQRWGTSP